MLDGLLRSAGAFLKSLVIVAGGSAPANAAPALPHATPGAIQEIEAGDGPRWGTLSGLTAHPTDPSRLFAVTDGGSTPLRIIELSVSPGAAPKVVRQIEIQANDLDDLDPEAIVAKPEGGFWIASEGAKNDEPANRLIEIDATGHVQNVIGLPETISYRMRKKGLEGIALVDAAGSRRLYVSFQAAIRKDDDDLARIGELDLGSGAWRFYAYPLQQLGDGTYTGLSEIVHVRDRMFALIERDGEQGPGAVKRISTVDLGTSAGGAPGDDPPVLAKHLAVDPVPLFTSSGREVEKEVEGLAIAADGQVYAITDNDNERPTLLLRLGTSADLFGS